MDECKPLVTGRHSQRRHIHATQLLVMQQQSLRALLRRRRARRLRARCCKGFSWRHEQRAVAGHGQCTMKFIETRVESASAWFRQLMKNDNQLSNFAFSFNSRLYTAVRGFRRRGALSAKVMTL